MFRGKDEEEHSPNISDGREVIEFTESGVQGVLYSFEVLVTLLR